MLWKTLRALHMVCTSEKKDKKYFLFNFNTLVLLFSNCSNDPTDMSEN